jgi:tetratricopeptide (TPR) repeat protein
MMVAMTTRWILVCVLLGTLIPALPASGQDTEGADRVEFMLFEASMDLEADRVIEALSALSEVLELDPERVEAHLLFGQALCRGLEQEVFDDANAAAANAITHFRWVLDRDPENPEALAGMEWLERITIRSGPYLTSETGIRAWARAQEALADGDRTGAVEPLREAIVAEAENPEVVHVHRLLGEILVETGETDEAIRTLETAVELGADDDGVHLLLGTAWEKKQDPARALEHYSRAMEYNSANREVVDRVVAILGGREREDLTAQELSILGRAFVNGEQYDKAVVVLDESLAADSLFASRKALGIAEFFRLNDGRAMEVLRAAHRDDTRDLEVLYYIGALQLRKGEAEDGRATLRQLLDVDPNNPNALRLMGLSLADDPDQAQLALRYLKAAYRGGATISGYPCLLGTLYMRLRQSLNASAQFMQCIEENPDYTGAYLGLGIVADDRGRTREAIQYLQEYLNREPNFDRGAAFRLGVAYLRSGQDDKGFASLRRVVGVGGRAEADSGAAEKDSNAAEADTLTDVQILEATSFFLATARRFQDAIFIGEMLLTRDSDNAVYNNNLAMSYADANHKVGRAHSLAVKANRLSPDNPGHMDTLGWTLVRMNRLDEAEETLVRSLEMAQEARLENLSEIYYHLGVLYHQQARHQESLDALTLALKDPPTEFLRMEIERVAEASRQLLEQDKPSVKEN